MYRVSVAPTARKRQRLEENNAEVPRGVRTSAKRNLRRDGTRESRKVAPTLHPAAASLGSFLVGDTTRACITSQSSTAVFPRTDRAARRETLVLTARFSEGTAIQARKYSTVGMMAPPEVSRCEDDIDDQRAPSNKVQPRKSSY